VKIRKHFERKVPVGSLTGKIFSCHGFIHPSIPNPIHPSSSVPLSTPIPSVFDRAARTRYLSVGSKGISDMDLDFDLDLDLVRAFGFGFGLILSLFFSSFHFASFSFLLFFLFLFLLVTVVFSAAAGARMTQRQELKFAI
jgi:hypothetical protein